ncbi:MAG: phage tail family protein [Lachnospiraceae bacterium]|nr:phage tail family protein [Lachnospiraceae bacterium]
MENEKLTFRNSRGESLEMGIDSVYHCNVSKDVSGIAGVTNVIYSTNSMGQHGDTYVGQRIEARDVDILGHINTRDKAQALQLRRQMLKILNPELSATLTYEYGSFKRVIDCRMFDEPKIERKSVLYEFNLQLECLNPFWREEDETKEDIANWVAAWHFPCVIDKESTKGMIFGYRTESVIVDCYNEGDVSTGMRIRFTARGTVENPILLNVDTGEFIQLNVVMLTGDVIEVNTKYGNKGAKLTRDGIETDCFRFIDVDSTFMQLAIGDNNFRYDAANGVNALEVAIFYSKEFLGV